MSIHFIASSQGWKPFPTANFAALIDGVRLDLGTFEGGRGSMIRSVSAGGVVYEARGKTISYEDFSKIVSAKKLTMIGGDLKYDISDKHLQALRDFHDLMQQEGREIN